MEHALYSLSKNPDTEIRRYERVTVVPSALGRATVWDKDVLLFAIRTRCAANGTGAKQATDGSGEPAKVRQLAPDRHPQQDFFLCSLLDVSPKDDRASMEHALYALSKKPDTVVRKYERVKVVPSVLGRPTVWDKDVILFATRSSWRLRTPADGPRDERLERIARGIARELAAESPRKRRNLSS